MTEKQSDRKFRVVVFAPLFNSKMNANRPLSVACVLSKMADVEVVTTDFDHWTKRRKEKDQLEKIAQIHYLRTLAYRSNVSPIRLLSHLLFSFSAASFYLLHRREYDAVYATTPFNTLAWLVFRLAGKRPKIVDVTDIWPDVLPFSTKRARKLSIFFRIWRGLFNGALAKADVMMAVSDSFFKESSRYVQARCHRRRFYLGEVELKRDQLKNSIFTVAYIGNIGRLYDFPTLLEVMSELDRNSIQLVIVGDGDRRGWLLGELNRLGVRHKYFGSVYDPEELGRILSSAHIGFNGFVDTNASFSTKASTYFAAGLPVLNSMSGDLEKLVLRHGLGCNYLAGDKESLKSCFTRLNEPTLAKMSENCTKFFVQELDRAKIRREMGGFLLESLKEYAPRSLTALAWYEDADPSSIL